MSEREHRRLDGRAAASEAPPVASPSVEPVAATAPEDGSDRSWRLPSLLRLDWAHQPEGLAPGSRVVRVLTAVGLAVAAIATRYAADTAFGGDLGYVTYVAAVAVSAWVGGLRAGLLTTVICGLGQGLVFSGFDGPGAITTPIELLRIAIFALDGLLISAITSALRRLSYREHEVRAATTNRYLAERQAHDRAEASRLALERFQTITASLAQATTPTEVAESVLERGLQALGAAAGGVSRISPAGDAVDIVAVRGYPSELIDRLHHYSLDTPSHFSHAVRTRTPVFIGNIEEWRERYPDAPAREIGDRTDAALAVAPLLANDRAIGAVVFRFDEARDFSDGTGDLILRLADQCAQALDRAFAYEEQHNAVGALERGNRRLEFLARASDLLGSTRDPETILQSVAKLAAASVADWCVIELLDADRASVAVGHPSPSGAAALRELASISPQNLAEWLAPDLARTGGSIVSDGALLEERLASPRATELLHDLGTQSCLVVPVLRSETMAGAVTLGARDGTRLGDNEKAMAQDLAARIATTIERSNLYGTVSRFKTTVDASLDAVYMFDPRTFELTYVNRGASEQAGAAADVLIGVSVLDLQPQLSRAELRARVQPLLSGEVPSIGYTTLLARRDGRQTPVDALLQCVRLPDGTVTLVLTARDMTERIEVQARLSRVASGERRRAAELNAILEAMREGVLVVDANRRVRLANAAAKEMCGGSPHTLDELATTLGVDVSMLPVFRPGADERTLELPDGRWMELSAYPTEGTGVPDVGEQGATIVVLRDVTRSREAAQAQEAFMGVLSHELRTPVTSIFGYAKVLQRPGLREQSAEMLQDIEAEADRLYRIVEDLLALSRVQAGFTVEGEPLLLQHLVGPLIAAEAMRWPHVTVEQQIPSDLPTVFGERTYVEQVLRNLLSNAAKYSGAGTTVTVSANVAGREVELHVLDRGAGIAPGEADKLFRLFYRSANTARQASGAGIGLYVCRGLVQAMGGRIWAQPRAGSGSEFAFSLPVVETEVESDDVG